METWRESATDLMISNTGRTVKKTLNKSLKYEFSNQVPAAQGSIKPRCLAARAAALLQAARRHVQGHREHDRSRRAQDLVGHFAAGRAWQTGVANLIWFRICTKVRLRTC